MNEFSSIADFSEIVTEKKFNPSLRNVSPRWGFSLLFALYPPFRLRVRSPQGGLDCFAPLALDFRSCSFFIFRVELLQWQSSRERPERRGLGRLIGFLSCPSRGAPWEALRKTGQGERFRSKHFCDRQGLSLTLL